MAINIRILPKGIDVEHLPGKSVLASALAAGITLPHSCDAGSCHVCRGKLLSGTVTLKPHGKVSHHDPVAKAILCCLATPNTDCILEIANVLAPGELPQFTVACQVMAATPLNHDVTEYVLKLPAGKKINYYPGQYLELLLNAGTDNEKSFPFSIANTPNTQRLVELQIRDIPNSDSLTQLKDALKVGNLVKVRLPSGDCTLEHIYGDKLRQETTPLVFLAGSTGFAPIKAMIEYCLEQKITRPIMLYWGGRTPEDLYLHQLALDWANQHKNLTYVPVISEPQNASDWKGRLGFVHQALMEDLIPFPEDLCIIAGGSPGMVHAAYDDFIAAGLNKSQLHSDVFAYAPR